MNAHRRGRLIALEGGEASGKSTQARLLAQRLDAVVTFEPGATALGVHIRQLLLEPDSADVSARAEALLMAADRAHHVTARIEPALAAGRHVVTDRFTGSTLAYQGYGRGLDLVELRRICDWAAGGLQPDLNVLLRVDAEVAASRLGGQPDRMEAAGDEFHRRVAAGFEALAAEDADRWVVVDGTDPVETVAGAVWHEVAARLGLDPTVG